MATRGTAYLSATSVASLESTMAHFRLSSHERFPYHQSQYDVFLLSVAQANQNISEQTMRNITYVTPWASESYTELRIQ